MFVDVSESADRNSDMMKQEVTRLQEMLNRLDFKRKVRLCIVVRRCDGMNGGVLEHISKYKSDTTVYSLVRRSCQRWML